MSTHPATSSRNPRDYRGGRVFASLIRLLPPSYRYDLVELMRTGRGIGSIPTILPRTIRASESSDLR